MALLERCIRCDEVLAIADDGFTCAECANLHADIRRQVALIREHTIEADRFMARVEKEQDEDLRIELHEFAQVELHQRKARQARLRWLHRQLAERDGSELEVAKSA